MTARYLALLASPAVKAAQEAMGSRHAYARHDGATEEPDRLGEAEAAFISARDSLYLASAGADGWPYLQHRGGPPGFLKVLDPGRLGLADFRGNRQYLSLGNVAGDPRVALFLMDYPNRRRMKLLGRMRAVDLGQEPALRAALVDAAYGAKVERGLVIDVEAFDWNCPQHIVPRFTAEEVRAAVEPMQARIRALEAEVARLRAG